MHDDGDEPGLLDPFVLVPLAAAGLGGTAGVGDAARWLQASTPSAVVAVLGRGGLRCGDDGDR